MFEYLFLFHKKATIFFMAVFVAALCAVGYYLFVYGKYDFYQVYVYPSEYVMDCRNADLCGKMKEESWKIRDAHLFFSASEPVNSKGDLFSDERIREFLDRIDKTKFVNDVFGSEFVPSQPVQTVDNGTFQWKTLNQMEKNCLDSIRTSIVPGSFEAEKITNERFASECSQYADGKAPYAPSDTKSAAYQDAEVSIRVSKVVLRYKFFKKQEGKFTQVDGKEIIKDYAWTFVGTVKAPSN